MGKKVGIDLGTTNSVIAISASTRPKVLDNRQGKPLTESVVSVKKRKGKTTAQPEEIIIGEVAYENWPMAPSDTIISIKRLMGRGIADPDVKRVKNQFDYEIVQPSGGTADSLRVIMGGEEFSPIDISAMILKKIKEDAEYHLGEEVTHAVITVPAYFSQIQKDATNKAAIKAGLNVLKILDEPTAAAIAYGLDAEDSHEARTILVYDLGGGTFDVSLLMWSQGVFAPLNLEGDMWLGGDNFDQELVDHTIEYVKKEYGIDPKSNLRFMATLKKKARTAKERLSASRTADIVIPGLLRDEEDDLIDVDLEVTREEFEDMIRPWVEKTVGLVEKAIHSASFTKDDIDFVLMVGNSTLVPMVQHSMVELFGRDKVKRDIQPKQCVALGAAIAAGVLPAKDVRHCYAPDPDDPEKACGEENPLDATHCKRCNAPFVESDEAPRTEWILCYAPDRDDSEKMCGQKNPLDATHCKRCGAPLLEFGNIAPYSYGIQTQDDKYITFIKNGDPYPTPDPVVNTFTTQKPNQRMISIPVYGGDHFEKASLNEKQGEAFAILPPGLYDKTPVHIKLWLDEFGIFALTAQLDDGTDLNPWIMKGERDQKVVEALQELEQKIGNKMENITPQQRQEIEQKREKAFEKMKKGQFEEASNIIEDIDVKPPSPLGAEDIARYADFILHEYKWALDPNRAFQLANLASELKSAMGRGDQQAIQEKMKQVEDELNNLPQLIGFLLGIRGLIESRIRRHKPKLANELQSEQRDIEKKGQAGDFDAVNAALPEFIKKVEKALQELPPDEKGVCKKCKTPLKGARFCPNCGHDDWGIEHLAEVTSSSQDFRRL